jgi:integrase/recombinase XerD
VKRDRTMANELVLASSVSVAAAGAGPALPAPVERAGGAARYAWEEFFDGEHHNPHTQRAYLRAVRGFLGWCEGEGVELIGVTPGMVSKHLVGLGGSPAKFNQHLAAVRGFFDKLVLRHVVAINPAASVRGVREQVIEGKTPEITLEQARALMASIRVSRQVKDEQGEIVEAPLVVGLRDRAILATMRFTACRAGAVAGLRLGDFQHDGEQYVLRFREKGGKSREIPVRLELQRDILAYLRAAGIEGEAKDRPLFRSAGGWAKVLTDRPLTTERICELVKRRLKDAGLPERLSPHSFRVAAITDLLTKGEKLEDVQYLAGHTEPRTTGLYDRRKKQVTRGIVERISA